MHLWGLLCQVESQHGEGEEDETTFSRADANGDSGVEGANMFSTTVTRPKEDITGEAQTLRGEAVARAIREWIVPVLVRTFLDDHARKVAAEPRPDDLAGTAQ